MEIARTNTHFWSEEQTRFMLTQLKELNIFKFMDGRKTKNRDIFKKVAQKLEEVGFPRTPKQVLIRWKNLKKAYTVAKRDNETSGYERILCPFYDLLDEILGSRPRSPAGHHGRYSDIATETEMKTEDLEETIEAPESSTPIRSPPASAPPPAFTSNKPGKRAKQSRSTKGRQGGVDVLVEEIRDMKERWEKQMERSEAREDRLIATILQSNAKMVATLMEGMRNFQTRSSAPNHSQATPSNPPEHSQGPSTSQYSVLVLNDQMLLYPSHMEEEEEKA
ncbi:uncharacterized protein PAE49_009294 [Odontesthes bonariensis]|uniref:uncharacterized protein LOC142385883 n=1 Tax=Odontesthes bonariensis TaxID=219752 RepID=UPI003F586582